MALACGRMPLGTPQLLDCRTCPGLGGCRHVVQYDKRFHTSLEESLKVPLIPEPPPFEPGKWKFIEGPTVTKVKHDAIVQMIRQVGAGAVGPRCADSSGV